MSLCVLKDNARGAKGMRRMCKSRRSLKNSMQIMYMYCILMHPYTRERFHKNLIRLFFVAQRHCVMKMNPSSLLRFFQSAISKAPIFVSSVSNIFLDRRCSEV